MTKKIFFELNSLEQYDLVLKCLDELIMKEDFILEAGFLNFEMLQVAKIVIGFYLHELKCRKKG